MLAIAGVAVVAGVAVPQASGRSVLPALQDRNLLLQLETVPGTSLAEMNRVSAAVVGGLRSMPGVTDVGAHVGRAIGSDQLVGVNSAEVWITLDDGADYGRSISAIQSMMREFGGVRATLLTYPSDRVAQAAGSQRDDLIVRVYGADLRTLQAKAVQVRTAARGHSRAGGARSCGPFRSSRPWTSRSTSPQPRGTACGRATSAGT